MTVIEGGARSFEPHRLTFYLVELVASFHRYYNKVRVLKNETALTRARLMLLCCAAAGDKERIGNTRCERAGKDVTRVPGPGSGSRVKLFRETENIRK